MKKSLEKTSKSNFSSSLGFVLAAAGSAVGLGNIWRFPYLAAKGGGGLFLLVYIILLLTFGFSLLTTDIAIGRKTGQNPLRAFETISKKWKFLGVLTFIVPVIILTYYSVVGGWITKYMVSYVVNDTAVLARDGYFTDFITSPVAPVVFMLIFLAATAFIVYCGVEKGIERFSKVIMPGLFILIIIIAIFSITSSYTDENGVTRTGLQGMAIYLIPNFEGITISKFIQIVLDAVCQLFYSLSVSMGIMITYGSYVKKDVNLPKSVTQIQVFDTLVAVLSGLMVIPAVYAFQGMEGMKEGAGLMFVSLPKVFNTMGPIIGKIVAILFFIMVIFAALTSSVSIMETVVADCMNRFKLSRKKMSLIVSVFFAACSVIICLGYNVLYFELELPNGTVGQLLDVADYLSNFLIMPIISILTCILIGWIKKPSWIVEEIEHGGVKFGRKKLYCFMIRYCAPVVMMVLLIKAIGIF